LESPVHFEGKVAVITGGASGIGRATALALARLGSDVAIADVNDRRLAEAEAELAALGRRVLAIHCDVARDDDVERLAGTVLAELRRVDLLMNNAGVVLRGAVEQIPLYDWRWSLDINLLGVVRGVRAFLGHMIERGSGHIVNTASAAGLLALTGEGAPYIASKFAVVGLSEALALYARPLGIGVSVLCPGSVDTNLSETARTIGMTPERAAAETAMAETIQGSGLMSPEQIAELVVDAVRRNRFFILADSAHQPILEQRVRDPNAFLEARLSGPDRIDPDPVTKLAVDDPLHGGVGISSEQD
jgi:NAD(P)-dependent dehydrogenase (short-subunit alcohol dehydrogenase family)